MVWLIKWLSVPILVIAVAIWFALANWFENGSVIVAYAIVAFVALFVWRRATFQLVPWLRGAQAHDLDPILKKKVTTIGFATLIGSLIVAVAALLVIVLCRDLRSQTGLTVAFTVMVVASFSKFGVMSVLARRLRDRDWGKVDHLRNRTS